MDLATAVPVEQIQNCQKRSSFEQAETALHQNISQKGANAYYFAHGRHFEIPEDAKIISGPGLVTGGPPELLKTCDTLLKEEDKITLIKEYSWADAGAKVKIYIPFEDLAASASEELINAKFESRSLTLDVDSKPQKRLKIEKFHAEIKPEECKAKVEVAKKRITVVLVKNREVSWSELVAQKSKK